MAKPINRDGSPRKIRVDCKFFQLPDDGKLAFVAQLERNPNVEQLAAIAAQHGVTWSEKNIYEFLKSPRRQEVVITTGVIRNRVLGQSLADAGADGLHADARRLAVGYWMTVARCAQEEDSGQRAGESAQEFTARRDRSRAEMSEATEALGTLGFLKAGEDKGAFNLAKLAIEREKLSQSERKIVVMETKLHAIRAVAETKPATAADAETLRSTVLQMVDEAMGIKPKPAEKAVSPQPSAVSEPAKQPGEGQ